ncbi:ankyrin repeat domain-containing protein [Wolbachia endosymbiont (group B) of Melanostoma mellinum]|uniref:ankyrin repeat domain-containing protein n=1 Tax=Wolbachia endosymbiont (group B) of Melanostoma mellinum TaxID=2954030 RepID=UPI00222F932F|nr:ankyrin repeat domain-containing protein [Wolbachia endosymbiont (group B) of Melanostoma mellinum]
MVQEQGYERYIQNERVKDLYGGILQKDVGSTKNSKLKGRLINAAGRIQLIRGIHGTVVSCADGDSIDCGLSVSGMAWSFASQPIENVIVKIAPKIVKSAGQFVGKMVPGTLGRQAQFAVAFTGAKIGSKIAKGVAGAVGGIFDIIDISRSASNLVDCKKREDSDNPCGKKEIRDEIVSMSFSSVSFVAGVALTAAGMPVVGIAIGFALMVGQGVYSGVSNIIEYEEKYDTTHDENWRIFWHTFAFQPIPLDVQHLAERKEVVNSLAKEVWKMLNNVPDNVVAYGVGLGKVSGGTLRPDHATIMMNTERADIRSLSRVIPDDIEGADMICLPKITNQDYEKGITSFVPSAKHYCKNALIIADKSKSMQSNKTVVFDLRNVNFGNIVGSKKWNNNFLIFEGSEKIIGVSNIVNRFVLTNSRFVGQIIMGINSTNVFDLSQIEDSVVRVNPVDSIISTIFQTLDYAKLEVGINQCITNYVNTIRYHYIGRHNKVDIVSCTTSTGDFIDCDTIIDSCGGNNDKQRDTIANCNKVVIAPYTDVLGKDGNYIFYVQSKGYKGKNLHSEIDVEGTGIVIFPENDLLNDCDNITYSSDTNTLSLRIVLGQNNRYTLDIKNYRKQGIIQPNFTLVDINGSNVVPKIREFGIRKINSFELHSEHSLDSLDNVKTHYKKIIGNNKSYEVFTVIRNKTQSQDDSKFQKMVFGSFGDDVINLDQGTIFAKGGEGSDLYFVSGDMDSEKVKIDNNSDDRSLDAISMPEVPEKFLMQGCDLYLDHNGTDIQVENYLKDNGYRHIAFVNGKGESFIPYIQSISCVGSSEENGKLVPFFHATPTQNMFVLPKGFQGDSVVIDSRPEEIERYKDRDDLLLVREGGIPFIIKVENFYNDRGGWENVNFLLWNDGNFSPYSGLYQKVSEVIDYQDKLKSDYEESFKEYVVDFTQSVNITHNQNDTLTSLEEDEKRIGVMILKNITPDRIQVSSSGRDLVFSDKVSNNVINIKNWSDSESYRISMLEFDLGLEPILIRRLDQFTLSNIEEIRNLVDKVSEICQSNAVCETNIEAENCNVQVSLHCAAASGQLDVVEKLVKELALADVNVKDSTGWTPLHYAAANGKLNVVRYLIGKVASVDVRGDLEQTPLLLAVENGRLDVVKYLIEKGADVDVRNDLEQTPLHLAAGNGRLDVVKYLIEEKEAYINTRDKFWITPLHLAARNGRLGVVKYLIEEKEADINIRDKFWITPLHLAAKNGELDVVEYITEKGSSTNVRDQSGTSPLHLAARNGRLDVVKYLIEKGADVDIRNKFGTMPVHLAAGNGRLDVVEYIIREWGDFNAYDWLGRVPLHYAAEGGKLDMVRYIIEKGANVNIKSKAREISLSVIDENNELEELEYFTKKRANVNVEDDFGFTPLHLAAENGKLNVVRYLIEEKHADINIKDNLGRTPLSLADDMMYYDVVEYLEKELNERKEIPKQRNRRHHHGDHDRHYLSRKPRATDSINQPEIVASSGASSSSWINDLFGWVKNSIGGLLGSRTALSKETSSTPSSISQVDAKMDVNGTIMLLDVLIRKVTDQKYISTVDQSISPLEAQGYALNITNGFKKVVEQAALKSGISMHRLDIDYMGMQKEITRKVMSGKFNEISGILNSYVEKAYPSREVGCPGKLSSKKFDKFMVEFNSGLLNQSIEQILHNRDGRLKVDDAKQMSLEPQSYLSNSSVQGHSKVSTCLSDIGVTKLVNNLSR